MLTIAALLSSFFRPYTKKNSASSKQSKELADLVLGARFHIISALLLVFSTALIVLFPAITVLKEALQKTETNYEFFGVLVFLALVFGALAHSIGKGDIKWIKNSEVPRNKFRDREESF